MSKVTLSYQLMLCFHICIEPLESCNNEFDLITIVHAICNFIMRDLTREVYNSFELFSFIALTKLRIYLWKFYVLTTVEGGFRH